MKRIFYSIAISDKFLYYELGYPNFIESYFLNSIKLFSTLEEAEKELKFIKDNFMDYLERYNTPNLDLISIVKIEVDIKSIK